MEKRKGKCGWVCILKNPSSYEIEYINPADIIVSNSKKSSSLGSILTDLELTKNGIEVSQKEIAEIKNEMSQMKNEINNLNELLINLVDSHNALLRAYKKNAAKTAMQLTDLEEYN